MESSTRMSQKVSKRLVIKWVITPIYSIYKWVIITQFTNHLLISWDIQVRFLFVGFLPSTAGRTLDEAIGKEQLLLGGLVRPSSCSFMHNPFKVGPGYK